ncbi:DUF1173 family protein [Ruegeria sp. HKCCD8929]|uniref:DUF1173 family protein n=1 Tax=Ruegeria sp. HKCCD8929 TaxID=2683006 RepID=UPI0014886370|nr:DUF1173 family protein [Ruegeria sp. HKCCD8929]
MSYFIGDTPVDPATDAGQARLAYAYKARDRVQCACRTPRPLMYIAAVNGRFIVKRMPSTGDEHAPGCASFLPPEELSGLAQVRGDAIREQTDDGTTTLKLDFPLTLSGTRPAPPEPSGKKKTEAKAPPKKLRLTALLHYLWHEAELVKWVPAMEGKRHWRLIHRLLVNAVQGKTAKSKTLSDILYVPEPWHVDRMRDAASRRQILFRGLKREGRRTPLGLLVAEYKIHEPARFGARFLFKQIPDCPFFADQELVDRFERIFSDDLRLADMEAGSHVMAIATFSIARKGYPVLQEIGLMLTTRNWIPFEHAREWEVIDALTSSKRAFLKSLRFNLDGETPIASAVLTDLPEPVSLFVADPSAGPDEVADLRTTAEEGAYGAWLWLDDGPMPALPGRGGKPSPLTEATDVPGRGRASVGLRPADASKPAVVQEGKP